MKSDPTKTLFIRNRAAKEVERRFNKIKTFVRDSIYTGKLITNVVAPRQYEFLRDPAKITLFNQQLSDEIDKEIFDNDLNGPPKDFWLNVYTGDAYDKGARKTRLSVERSLPNMIKLPDYSPLANWAHIERAELIFTRVFNDMRGVTDTMKGQMSSVLADGMLQGKNPKEVAEELTDRVDKIGITRARLIARTEIIESHNQASIKEADLLESETGITIKMQWVTSIDGRERPTHRARHLKIYTREEVLSLIGEPNCRCSTSAYIDIAQIRKKS